MKVVEADINQLLKLIQKRDKPVIIFLCKRTIATYFLFSPILKDLQFQYQEKIIFYEIKWEHFVVGKGYYSIHRNPTFLFFRNGELFHKLEGFVNRQKVFKGAKQLLEKSPREVMK